MIHDDTEHIEVNKKIVHTQAKIYFGMKDRAYTSDVRVSASDCILEDLVANEELLVVSPKLVADAKTVSPCGTESLLTLLSERSFGGSTGSPHISELLLTSKVGQPSGFVLLLQLVSLETALHGFPEDEDNRSGKAMVCVTVTSRAGSLNFMETTTLLFCKVDPEVCVLPAELCMNCMPDDPRPSIIPDLLGVVMTASDDLLEWLFSEDTQPLRVNCFDPVSLGRLLIVSATLADIASKARWSRFDGGKAASTSNVKTLGWYSLFFQTE
jgi:hypothetical protein